MLATRRLCARHTGSSGFSSLIPKLLLPTPSASEVAWSAVQGCWAHATSQESRDAYESMVSTGVVKDAVLHNARNGSVLTYSLFHDLHQNPLVDRYNFDAKEFVSAVGPALENFHDTVGKLQNQLSDNIDGQKAELDEKMKMTDEEIIGSAQQGGTTVSMTEALLGINHWRGQADEDEDGTSPAGVLTRMTTEALFDSLYYKSKLEVLGRAPQEGGMPLHEDCAVNEVALLRARVAYVRREGGEGEFDHEEFRATEELMEEPPVGAQMDVLYEVTHMFQLSEPTTSQEEKGENGGTTDEETINKDDNGNAAKKITITNLAVAVFEGWLHGGPMKELRWRLAMIREASEFPLSTSAITRQ